MEVTQQKLHQRYLEMENEELIELYRTSDLTDMASMVLNGVLIKRGITKQEKTARIEHIENATNRHYEQYGFFWWILQPVVGLSLGNLALFWKLHGQIEAALIGITINTFCMVLILRYNKYAFLFATIASFNPFIWILNGIYLKHRWNHPKLNKRHTKVENNIN